VFRGVFQHFLILQVFVGIFGKQPHGFVVVFVERRGTNELKVLLTLIGTLMSFRSTPL
jgi:hypothetical protein